MAGVNYLQISNNMALPPGNPLHFLSLRWVTTQKALDALRSLNTSNQEQGENFLTT